MADAKTEKNLQDTKVIAKLFQVTVRRIQQLTQEGILETVEIKRGKCTLRRYDVVPTLNTLEIRHTAGNRKKVSQIRKKRSCRQRLT